MPTRSANSRRGVWPSSPGWLEVTNMRVGFIGWRGMVGSVLMQRMQEERDFVLIQPEFFTTSNVGGAGPAIGGAPRPLKRADDLAALAQLDAIVTCQGGDYTNDVHP